MPAQRHSRIKSDPFPTEGQSAHFSQNMQKIPVIAKGEKSYVNRKRAERLVHRGQARWEGQFIRLVDHSHRVISAARCEQLRKDAALDRAVGSGFATIEQIAGLPMLGDPMKLLIRRRA